VQRYFFDALLVRVEAPVHTLIVFIAVEAAAWDPLAIYESALVYGSDAYARVAVGAGRERDSESLAGAEKCVFPVGHDAAEAALRRAAEAVVETHVQRVAVDGEVDRLVVAIENEAVHVASGLVLKQERRDALQHAVAFSQRVFVIGFRLEGERGKAEAGFFAKRV